MNVVFWYYAAIILECISILISITSGWLSFKGKNDYADFNIGLGIFFLGAGVLANQLRSDGTSSWIDFVPTVLLFMAAIYFIHTWYQRKHAKRL